MPYALIKQLSARQENLKIKFQISVVLMFLVIKKAKNYVIFAEIIVILASGLTKINLSLLVSNPSESPFSQGDRYSLLQIWCDRTILR